MPAFEEKEAGAKSGKVDVSKEVDKSFKLGFDRHEDVKGVLGSAKILLKCEAEERRERSSLKDGGRRDATEKGSRNGRIANPNSSPRIAGPDSMGANGLRQVSKRKMSAPKAKRSAVLNRVASEVSSPKGAGRAGQ